MHGRAFPSRFFHFIRIAIERRVENSRRPPLQGGAKLRDVNPVPRLYCLPDAARPFTRLSLPVFRHTRRGQNTAKRAPNLHVIPSIARFPPLAQGYVPAQKYRLRSSVQCGRQAHPFAAFCKDGARSPCILGKLSTAIWISTSSTCRYFWVVVT